ncbi:MAG: CotH kinase family protein [Fibrobacterales bacterium]
MSLIKIVLGIVVSAVVFGCSENTIQETNLNEGGGVSSADNASPSSSADENASDEENESSGDNLEELSSSERKSEGSNKPKEYNTGDPFELPELDGDSAYIFDDDELRTYNILIDPDALWHIDSVPQDEVYEYADLVFEGDTIKDVQVRYKGSTGAWYPCTNNENGSPWPPGPNSCIKLSTKVKFNTETDPDRKFFGLKKLQFHHMHWHKSQMRERVVYWFHNAMGNPAPRSVHARVLINGELNGLYALVEQIDGRFTRERWEDGEGNIYKNNMILQEGVLSEDTTLFNVLKTNEDEDPVYTQWQTFEEELDAAEDGDAIKEVIATWMDVPLTVRTVITSMAVGHWDSPYIRYKYTHHNSYWYSDTTEQKIYSIPWDADNAIISLSGRKGERTNGAMSVEEVAQALNCNSPVENKLQRYWLCYPDEVKATLDKLLDEVYPQVSSKIDKWETQIEEVTQEVFDIHGATNEKGEKFPRGALTMEQWQDAVDDLRAALVESERIVTEWRSGLE